MRRRVAECPKSALYMHLSSQALLEILNNCSSTKYLDKDITGRLKLQLLHSAGGRHACCVLTYKAVLLSRSKEEKNDVTRKPATRKITM